MSEKWKHVSVEKPDEFRFVLAQIIFDPSKQCEFIPVYAWHETNGEFYAVEIYFDEDKLTRVISYQFKYKVVCWMYIPELS